ncbi:MAG: hypothetical protein KAG98_00715 [Lentisphaeria bacterium]|nr:hypothetical protein [Lentisphaeria bacterium]
MINLDYESVHFIGIGGVGMSGMATILKESGTKVTGSDLVSNHSIIGLRSSGIEIKIGPHQTFNVSKDCDLVVFSSAVGTSNPEMIEAKRRGIPVIRRGLFLAELGKSFPFTIAVSGSHGKTTTTAMLVHIFKSLELNPAYMVGGAVATWSTNASLGSGKVFITEIDESDGTQSYFEPDLSIILNIEDDHAWSAGGKDQLFESFKTVAQKSKQCFSWKGAHTQELLSTIGTVIMVSDENLDPKLTVPQIGQHNLIDATMALQAALAYGLKKDDVIKALSTFPGVKRRMTKHGEDLDRQLLLLEDYAHHPTELACFYEALQEVANGRKLVIIFQPHRYERIKRYHHEFSLVLAKFDQVILLPPFAAWKADQSLADPKLLLSELVEGQGIYWQGTPDELPAYALKFFPIEQVIVSVVGAGDIAKLVEPLTQAFGL